MKTPKYVSEAFWYITELTHSSHLAMTDKKGTLSRSDAVGILAHSQIQLTVVPLGCGACRCYFRLACNISMSSVCVGAPPLQCLW